MRVFKIGGTYWKLGERELAIDSFKKILRLDPDNKMAIATLQFFEESAKEPENNLISK